MICTSHGTATQQKIALVLYHSVLEYQVSKDHTYPPRTTEGAARGEEVVPPTSKAFSTGPKVARVRGVGWVRML